jgi:hypothetical protein
VTRQGLPMTPLEPRRREPENAIDHSRLRGTCLDIHLGHESRNSICPVDTFPRFAYTGSAFSITATYPKLCFGLTFGI